LELQRLVDGERVRIAVHRQNWHAKLRPFIGEQRFEIAICTRLPIDLAPSGIAVEQDDQPTRAGLAYLVICRLEPRDIGGVSSLDCIESVAVCIDTTVAARLIQGPKGDAAARPARILSVLALLLNQRNGLPGERATCRHKRFAQFLKSL